MALACCLWSDSAWEAPPGLSIPNGCRASSFILPDGAGAGGLGFFDGLDVGDLCFLDSCEAQDLSIQGNIEADGSGFFNGLCCLGLIPTKFHTQFPDGSPPAGIYG